MTDESAVSDHYTLGSLIDRIIDGVEKLGKSPETVTIEDLGPVEEFHIGGRTATGTFLAQLDLKSSDHVLDIGCGLGGASRFVSDCYGVTVTGIDLTAEYIETGRTLNEWVGLENSIQLDQGNATELPYDDAAFDKAYMMHVGMNIADKERLIGEVCRVLKPNGRLGLYDVMLTGSDDLVFPVPWATTAAGSCVDSPQRYRELLEAAGFVLTHETDRRDFAVEFFARLKANAAAADGPPPLGLHLLMGENAPLKVKNMIENIAAGRVAPIEMIAGKAE